MITIAWQDISRIRLLQHLIQHCQYQSYLEIGCDKNQVFDQISVPVKEGVDPRRGGTQRMTSDAFFAQDDRKWDLIFIDGLHTYEQVKRDFDHAFVRLNLNGTIVIHDMLPTTPGQAQSKPVEKHWLGDVWKLAFDLASREDLEFKILTMDFGCGVVKHGRQTASHFDCHHSNWQFYLSNYQQLPLSTFEQYFNHAHHQS